MYEVKNITKLANPDYSGDFVSVRQVTLNFTENKVNPIYYSDGNKIELLLQILSGLTSYDSGSFNFDQNCVYIPKQPSSFPWLTVKENIVYGLDKIESDRSYGVHNYELMSDLLQKYLDTINNL